MAELAGEGQIYFNGGMCRSTYTNVTGKRRRAEIDGDEDGLPVLGMLHEMLPKLTDSLILTAKKYAKSSCKEFFVSLGRQKESHKNK